MIDEKAQRIAGIVGDIIGLRRSGAAIDYASFEQRHPELMPELGTRLRRLRAIEDAAQTALDSHDAAGDRDDDIHFLRSQLTDYEVLERINYGGQGVVYRAVQTSTRRVVAIKVLLDGPLATPRQRDRFAREVELLARLRHPQVVTIYESGEVARRPYLVMEYVDGVPIDDYVLLHQLPVMATVELFKDVCLAVAAAHQRGVLHRDLKPANILVDENGQPHVLDFGLAKDLVAEAPATISHSGQIVGTLPYLSPEQASGSDAAADVRSDIYTLGVLLYELLAGEFPYVVAGPRGAVLQQILSAAPRPLRRRGAAHDADALQIDSDLERIVLKALEKDPAQRYQSAFAMAEDLRRFLAGDVIEARAHSGLYLLRKTLHRYRRHLLISAAVLVILAVSLAGTAIMWLRAERIGRIAQAALVMDSSIQLGSVERDAGRMDVAIDAFRRAIQIGDEIASTDPAVMRNLFLAHHRLATLYDSEKRHVEGRSYLARAVQIARELMETSGSMQARRDYSFALNMQGRYAWSDQQWDRALAYHQECTTIRQALLRDDPDNIVLRKDLADTYRGEARSLRKIGRMDEALERLTSSQDILAELVVLEPQVIDHEIELARIEGELSVFHLTVGTEEANRQAALTLDRLLNRLARLRENPRARGRQWDISGLAQDHEKNRQIAQRRLEASDQGSELPSPLSTGSSSPSSSGSAALVREK